MKQVSRCCNCGGDLKFIETDSKYKCLFCGTIFEEEKAISIQNELNNAIDELKQERIANLKKRLWEATHEKYMSSEKILSISREILTILPDDFLGKFYETMNSKSNKEINEFIEKIDVKDKYYQMDMIIEYLIKTAETANLLVINNLIDKTYKTRDLSLFDKYTTELSNVSKELDEGIYDLDLPRDVFIAYSSKDIKYVEELVNVLEENDIKCFVALRNLRHGKGAYENYEKSLEKAIDNCKIFLLVSTPNSRSRECDAFSKEMVYIKKKDIEYAPAEYKYDYSKIPLKYKKPRIEYLVGSEPKGTVIDEIVAEFFKGLEWCYNPKEVARKVYHILEDDYSKEEEKPKEEFKNQQNNNRAQTFFNNINKKIDDINKRFNNNNEKNNDDKKYNNVIYNNDKKTNDKKDEFNGKNPWVVFVLCLFLGFFGAHFFYMNKNKLGIFCILTFGFFVYGWFFMIIIYLLKALKTVSND